jgi:hypothetical protein
VLRDSHTFKFYVHWIIPSVISRTRPRLCLALGSAFPHPSLWGSVSSCVYDDISYLTYRGGEKRNTEFHHSLSFGRKSLYAALHGPDSKRFRLSSSPCMLLWPANSRQVARHCARIKKMISSLSPNCQSLFFLMTFYRFLRLPPFLDGVGHQNHPSVASFLQKSYLDRRQISNSLFY